MSDNKKFSKEEKAEVLRVFGESLNDESLQIIENLLREKKDLNKLLLKAYPFRNLC